MGLQIWLPMNGNLENQGVFNTSITSSGSIANANGKIGSCMKITSQTDSGYIPNFNTTGLTMGGWFKFNKSEIASVVSGLSYSSTANSATGNLIGNDSYGGIGLIWIGNNYYSLQSFESIYICAALRTSTVNVTTSGFTIDFDKWIHLMLVWDPDSRKLSIYKNGNVFHTTTVNNFSDGVSRNLYLNYRAIYGGNGPHASIPMYCNDIRVYDNALTANEIKKIAQGLVLHYPLSDGFGGENICKVWDVSLSGSDFGSYSTRTYDTTTHIGKIQVTSTNNKWNAWRFGTSDLDTPCTTLTTGTNTYTMSVDIKVTNYTSGTIRCGFDFRTNNAVSSLATVTLTAEQCNGKWHRVSSSLTTNNQQNTACLWSINSNNTIHGSQTTIEYKNWKLERGDKATPWIPNKSNSDYSKIGLNSNIVYDVSGYGNNGTKSGTISYSSDTPRYNVSTGFDGSQYIQLPFPCGMISEAVTVACWGYESNWNTTYAERLIGAATGSSGWCIGDYGSENTLFAFYANGSYNTAFGFKQLSDGWHYFVITFDGINLKYYVDGVLFSSKTFSTKQSATGVYNIQIGQHYGGACSFKGKISDVRIYATALSADDILELYKTPSYLASNAS